MYVCNYVLYVCTYPFILVMNVRSMFYENVLTYLTCVL